MKKLKYAGLALLIMLFTSSSASAAGINHTTWATSGSGFESLVLTPIDGLAIGAPSMTLIGSKNVSFNYVSTDLHYLIGTNHKSGSKTYGASSDSSKIWAMTDTAKGTPSTLPTPVSNEVDWSVQAGFSAQ